MKKQIHILAIAAALMLSVPAAGQDGRYSQFFNNPVYLNPAMAGNGIQYIRVTGIYRTQWAGMGTPFTTQGLAVDKSVNRFGIGGYINRQGAGDNGIRTLNIVGNLAYHFSFGEEKLNTLSAGLQVGLINKSFDPNKMTFDNQYDPDAGYDPNMSSGEVFTTTSVSRPDVTAGFSWQRGWGRDDIWFRPFASISFAHLNKPNETFIIDGNKAPVKTTLYTGAAFQVTKEVVVTPSVLLMKQDHFRENTFGATCAYKLNNSNSIQFGIFNRMDDALIVYTGYQLNQVMLGMSYDANTSSLSKSGKGFNAFEISLSWSPLPKKKPEPEFDPEMEPLTEMQLPLLGAGLIPVKYPEIVMTEIPVIAPAIPAIAAETSAPAKTEVTEPKVTPAAPAVEKTIEKATAATPAADSDKDGIADASDGCPFIKGSAATGGCPDSDADGIHDLADKCPMEAGVAATGGCPEPGAVAETSQTLVKKYNNVLFEPGSKALNTPDIFDIIERAIEQMYRDKTTRAVLSGHTDNEGNAAANMVLSQNRAEAVKKYMVKMGIDPSRITTVPYGENMPLENNIGNEGRRLNRRVEINIVK